MSIWGAHVRRPKGDKGPIGEASYHPSVLLGLLVCGYATGVFSSRKLERATYDSVAFRFIAANDHPDHETIASRRRFLTQIEALFVQVLMLADAVARGQPSRRGDGGSRTTTGMSGDQAEDLQSEAG